jgi:hypothetical protein
VNIRTFLYKKPKNNFTNDINNNSAKI